MTLCRRLFAVVEVEASVDLAVDFQGDPVEASQEALEDLVVDPVVAMEDPLGVMEDPMEVVMEEAISVGEELHSGLVEAMVDSRKAREHQQVDAG